MPQNLNEIEGWLLAPQQEQEQQTAAIPFSQRVRQARQGSESAPAPAPMPEFSVIPGPDEEPAANYLIEALSIPEVLFLDRAVRGAIYAVSKDEGVEGVLSRFLKGSPLASLADIIAGTEFSENVTSEMLWKAWGDEDPGFLKAFVTDIALGPSTWVGLGSLTKLGKAMRGGQMFLEVSGLAEAAAQSSHALPAITRSGKKLLFGTAEDIAAAGGKAGRKLSLTELTLTEQAEAGLRGVNFGVGEWALWAPRNFNIALYNGAESVWEGAKRSAIGKAVRQVASPLPQIGEGMGGGTADNVSKTIQAQRAIQEEAWQRNAVGALYGDLMERGMTPLLANVPEEMRHVMQPLQEWGLAGVNAALDPQVARHLFEEKMIRTYAGSSPEAEGALRDFLSERIFGATPQGVLREVGGTWEANIAVSREIADRIVKSVGLSETAAEAHNRFYRLVKLGGSDFTQLYSDAKQAAAKLKIPMPESSEDLANLLQTAIGSKLNDDIAEAAPTFAAWINRRDKVTGKIDKAQNRAFKVMTPQTKGYVNFEKFVQDRLGATPTYLMDHPKEMESALAQYKDFFYSRARKPYQVDDFKEFMGQIPKVKTWFKTLDAIGVADDIDTLLLYDLRPKKFGQTVSSGDFVGEKLTERADSFLRLPDEMRSSIRRSSRGHRTLIEKMAGGLAEAGITIESIATRGTDYIDAATRKKLAATSAKVERALGSNLPEIAGAPIKPGSMAPTSGKVYRSFVGAYELVDESGVSKWNPKGKAGSAGFGYADEAILVEFDPGAHLRDAPAHKAGKYVTTTKTAGQPERFLLNADYVDGNDAEKFYAAAVDAADLQKAFPNAEFAFYKYTDDAPGTLNILKLTDAQEATLSKLGFVRREASSATADQLVRASTRAGAKAVTWNDLVQAGVKAIDDVNAFMLNQEKAAGVAVMMAEHYFSHVSTPAGKKLFDAFGKAAIGESSPLAKEYFTRSRQMSGWTVGEMNAVLHEMGFKASGDNPGKMIAEMDEFLIEKIKKVDPDYIKKIRAVDPAAAAYWESNVSAVMKRRASAGALATARAGLMKGISDTFEEGGLAIKRWNVPEGADLHAIQREMAAMRNVNTEIVNVEDIFKPRRIGPRKLESETELMLRQGIDDAARQGLHEDLKAIEDAFTESFGVPPARGIREGGTYIAIDRSLLNEVLGAHAKMTSPKYVFRMMQAMETATNFWKTWTLSPFPSFHFRNLAGDTILASLGGMGPRELGSTLPEMMKLKMASAGIGGRGLTDITVDLGHLGKRSGAEFLQLAKEQGVVGHSFTATEAYAKAEIDAAKAQNLRWKDWIPFMSGNRNALIRAGNAVGQTVNDTTRMAFFADQIRKGAAPIEAARATKKFLIDYTSDLLTHVESAYLKPLIPFYTWLRRSVPLMMEHAIRNPAIPATFGKALRSWTQAGAPGDLPDTLVPDYVQDMYGVPYKTGDDGTVSYFLLGGWVPGSDIARLGQALVERDDRSISTALSYVNPLLKVPVELLADKSAFTGGEIERFEGQTYEMFGMPWSAKTAYFLKQIRMVNELDKLNVLGVERTGEQGQRSQADAVDRWLGFLVGGKPTEVNPKEERRRSEFVIEREIGKAKAELNRLARSPKTVGREEQMDALKQSIKDGYRELGRMNSAFSSFRKKVAQQQ